MSQLARIVCVPLLCLGLAAGQSDSKSKAAEKPQDFSREALVLEQQQTKMRFESDGTARKQVHARIRVQSEGAVQQLGQLVVGYNSAFEKPSKLEVRVIKPDGTMITTPESAIQDLSSPVSREAPMYSDLRQKHVTVSGLRPGDVLEYDFTSVQDKPLAPQQFWFNYDFDHNNIVLDEELEIDVPADKSINLKTQPDAKPTISESGGRRIYRWKKANLSRDDDSDSTDKKRKKRDDDQPPAIQLTTFRNWEEVGRWYAELERDRVLPDDAIRQKAAELTKGRNGDIEKLDALYSFVSRDFRYVSLSFGVGRYQPHAAGEVYANRYGDCKDKHTLLAAMSEAAGIHAYAALIPSSRKLDPEMPSPAQFDHVITFVPVGKEDVWLDSTIGVSPFRLLMAPLRKKQALVVYPSSASRLVETPPDPYVGNKEITSVEGSISELGKLSADVRLTVRGDVEVIGRLTARQMPKARWKDLVEAMVAAFGLGGNISNVEISDPDDIHSPFEYRFHVERPGYVDFSHQKVELNLPLSFLKLREFSDEDSQDKPLELGGPMHAEYRLKLSLPAKFQTQAPLPVKLARDYGEYGSKYSLHDNIFEAERVADLKARELPSARLFDYQAFRRAAMADADQDLTITPPSGGVLASAPAEAKPEELLDAAEAAYQSGNYATAVELVRRVLAKEPKHKSAWNQLGLAYLAMRQSDKAIEALRTATELNPYDPFAWNNLGRAYWLAQKYSDAEAAFNKQIETDPLDRWAHSNLGQMLLEERKYKEAAAELEKALAITPQNPGLLVSLGQAQLESGETQKAQESFDKAVELAPSPAIWNNVAYELSRHRVNLDRAQQFAELAVATTATQLRDVRLDNLQIQHLGLVTFLAACWDTLGWVHFQRGNVEMAEKYIRAAWELLPHGEVGDHLAQIYEKRGDKRQAAQMFAEALGVERPYPDTRPHLLALVGEKEIDPMVKAARQEVEKIGVLRVPRLPGAEGTADFYLLISREKTEDVKFVSGSEKMRVMAEPLRKLAFQTAFPDDTAVKLVRRASVVCPGASKPPVVQAGKKVPAKSKEPVSGPASSDCVVKLLSPEAITSLN